jgi:hypothetical protein
MDETFQGSNKFGTTDLFFKLGIGQSAKLAMVKAREELELKIPLLDKVDINSIVNLTALVFLEEWLENDQNATQTVHSFYYYPYTLKSELKGIKGSIPTDEDEAGIKVLRKAESVFKSMSELRTEQAEKEGIKEPAIADMTSKGRFYSFIDLRFMELYKTLAEECRQIEIFDLFARRKELMMLTTKSKNPYDFLKSTYLAYYDIFRKISEVGDDVEKVYEDACRNDSKTAIDKTIEIAGEKAREYVVATMQIHKFEMAFRFHLIALLAKWTVDHQLSDMDLYDYLDCLFVLCNRYEYPLVIDDEDLAEMIDLPWDILFCEAAIPLLSSEDEKSAEASFEYCVEYRRLLSASIASMNAMFPPKEMPSWTDRAFIEAHSFIRDAYPIAEKISEYTPSQLDDEKYYRRIVEIYQYIDSDEIQKDSVLPLSEFRKAMKESTSRKKKPRASET